MQRQGRHAHACEAATPALDGFLTLRGETRRGEARGGLRTGALCSPPPIGQPAEGTAAAADPPAGAWPEELEPLPCPFGTSIAIVHRHLPGLCRRRAMDPYVLHCSLGLPLGEYFVSGRRLLQNGPHRDGFKRCGVQSTTTVDRCVASNMEETRRWRCPPRPPLFPRPQSAKRLCYVSINNALPLQYTLAHSRFVAGAVLPLTSRRVGPRQ